MLWTLLIYHHSVHKLLLYKELLKTVFLHLTYVEGLVGSLRID